MIGYYCPILSHRNANVLLGSDRIYKIKYIKNN